MIRLSVADSVGRRIVEFPGEEILLGRREGVDLFLNDPAASRNHCILRAERGRILLIDLGSENGSFVGGKRVHEAALAAGQEFRVGASTIRIEGPPVAAAAAAPAEDAEKRTDPGAAAGPSGAPDAGRSSGLSLMPESEAPAPALLPPAPPAPPGPAARAATAVGAAHPAEEEPAWFAAEFSREVRRALRPAPWYLVSLALHALLLFVLTLQAYRTRATEIPVAIASGDLDEAAPSPEIDAEVEFAPPPEAIEELEEPFAPPVEDSGVASEQPAPADGEKAAEEAVPGNPAAIRLKTPLRPPPGPKKSGTPLKGTLEEAHGEARRALERGLGDGLGTLRGLPRSRIVVVEGAYDQMERVLDLYRIPHTVVERAELDDALLRDARVLFLNCSGRPEDRAVRRLVGLVRGFAERGGWILSSDWAIDPFVVEGFPGMVQIFEPRQSQPDTTIGVVPADPTSPLLEGVFPRGPESRWWLEQSSKFFRVQNRREVKVLVRSDECLRRFGTSEIAVEFPSRRGGRILHLLGHFWQKQGTQEGIVAMHRLVFNFVLERFASESR